MAEQQEPGRDPTLYECGAKRLWRIAARLPVTGAQLTGLLFVGGESGVESCRGYAALRPRSRARRGYGIASRRRAG